MGLAEGGADVNAQDEDGRTPLHRAPNNGSLRQRTITLGEDQHIYQRCCPPSRCLRQSFSPHPNSVPCTGINKSTANPAPSAPSVNAITVEPQYATLGTENSVMLATLYD